MVSSFLRDIADCQTAPCLVAPIRFTRSRTHLSVATDDRANQDEVIVVTDLIGEMDLERPGDTSTVIRTRELAWPLTIMEPSQTLYGLLKT